MGGRATVQGSPHGIESVYVFWLGLCRLCGDRGVEESAALRDFSGALRRELLLVLRHHPGVAPVRPHVRLADVGGPIGHHLHCRLLH